jgi:hypothetical protein
MFLNSTIKVSDELYRRAAAYAADSGYPSVHNFVSELLERELKSAQDKVVREKVLRQMKGLGYLQ